MVQVILEDKTKFESNSNVLFTTTVPSTVPPLVTTIMENDLQVVEDGGTARPNFLRPTIYQVPVTEDHLKTTDIPLGLAIKPFDEQEVEGKIVSCVLVSNYIYLLFIFFQYVPVTNSEIVRCNRCKSYMNPYNRFVDCGRRFQCSLCKHVTEVPAGYFANLDHTGMCFLHLFSFPFLTFSLQANDLTSTNDLNSFLVHMNLGQLKSIAETVSTLK